MRSPQSSTIDRLHDVIGMNALQLASMLGRVEMVELLLNCGADVAYISADGTNALLLATERRDYEGNYIFNRLHIYAFFYPSDCKCIII
jgi:ankyrin repeat protein